MLQRLLLKDAVFGRAARKSDQTRKKHMDTNILVPLLLTLGAGLATGIGSAIAFFARRTNKRLLSFSLGLSGGVMIYVSFVELFHEANLSLTAEWGPRLGSVVTVPASSRESC